MLKTSLLLSFVAIVMIVLVAGCSDTSGQKPKTVVVNKGLSKKQEQKLDNRVDKLEKKVNSQDKKGSQENAEQTTESAQPEPSQAPQPEEQARAAAEAYYEAVAARNWGYTYDHLDSETQSAYTEQGWAAKNDHLADTGAVTYTIQSVAMDSSAPETIADVTVVLTATDGSTNVRNTYFVYEDGSWLHSFSTEEYDLLASAPTATASASSTASASASATAPSSPSASPDPSPNRNNNAPRRDAPGNARSSGGGGGSCPQGGHWVGIDGPGDGDSDGCAGE
jgi:hypothetical protein